MRTNLRKAILWVSHLLFDVGKAAAILVSGVAMLGAALYLWFGGASLTVLNQSGYDLEDVRLLVGHSEAGIEQIWRTDLEAGETEWSYTFTGKDRAVLLYSIDKASFEVECLYPSEGLAVSARMTINSDGSLTCDSDMRI